MPSTTCHVVRLETMAWRFEFIRPQKLLSKRVYSRFAGKLDRIQDSANLMTRWLCNRPSMRS